MIRWEMSHVWIKVEVQVEAYSENADRLQDRDIIRENINIDIKVSVCTEVSRSRTGSSDVQLSAW
jgi:hypothetical protein